MPYSLKVQALLDQLVLEIRQTLGKKLLGYYVYGSLVWGDFDEEISDLDTLALLRTPLTEEELEELRRMHVRIGEAFPGWGDRIEVQYADATNLQTFRTKPFVMGNISPGEPLHFIPSNRDWLLNWYFVREYGVTLYGPDPKTVLPVIDKQEFLDTVLDQVKQWRDHYLENVRGSRPYQGYAVLTICRSLYTLTTGEQTSKRKAMEWVVENEPRYAELAQNAWEWREHYRDEVDPSLTADLVCQKLRELISDLLARFDHTKS